MAKSKSNKKNIRKLTKMGGGRSFGITLPIDMLKELKWKEHQKLIVKKSGSRFIIKDWKK